MPHGAALLIVSMMLLQRGASAQLPVHSLRLALGFGVDTTGSPAHEVFELWRHYLEEPSDSARAALWSPAERAAWQPYDLLGPYVYQGFRDYTVVRLTPEAGLSDTYRITTLVATVDDSTHAVQPLALYRVYAAREAGHWVLANALPRTTRTWRRESVGAITFVCPPAHAKRRLKKLFETAPLLVEGLMTWVGGSAGLSYSQLRPGLARYLAAHPAATLEKVLRDPPPRTGTLDVGYDGLAVLCDLVHRRRGLAGLRAVLQSGRAPDEVLDAAARQLGISRGALESLWRATILRD